MFLAPFVIYLKDQTILTYKDMIDTHFETNEIASDDTLRKWFANDKSELAELIELQKVNYSTITEKQFFMPRSK